MTTLKHKNNDKSDLDMSLTSTHNYGDMPLKNEKLSVKNQLTSPTDISVIIDKGSLKVDLNLLKTFF